MKTRQLLSAVCLLALAFAGCATTETTEAPAAAEGAPATAEPTTGGEATPAPAAEPAPAATAPAPAPATPAPAPVAAEPAAQPSQPTAPQMPAVGVIVTHKVKDYAAWKPVFDAHQDARKAAGILGHGLMADVANDKLVTLWLPASDAAKVGEFAASKDLKDKMKEAGVIGKPTVLVTKPVAMQTAQTAAVAALVTIKVKDFDAFKTAFEGAAQARTDAGVAGYGIAQDVKDAKTAYLYLQGADAEKLKAFVGSKDTKKAWKDAGVIGAAKATYVKEIEQKMYN